MKKLLTACLSALMIGLSGCSDKGDSSGLAAGNSLKNEKNIINTVYDKEGNEIGSFEQNGLLTLARSKIVTVSYASDSSSDHPKTDFCMYDLESKENVRLGTVNDLYSEASFDRVLIGDHLYTSMTIGQNNDRNNWMYTLLDIDLKNKTMNTLLQEKSTFVYNHLARADDDLLLLRKGNGGMKIERYSPADGSISLLKQYTYNDDSHTGETARDLYYKDGILYVLRLKSQGEKSSELYIDKYGKDMELISSTNVTDIARSDLEGVEDEEKQAVKEFICTGDLVYYENRSITQFLGKIDGGKLSPIVQITTAEGLSAARTASDQGRYRVFSKALQEGNRYYVLDLENGELTEGELYPKGADGYVIESIVQGEKKLLVNMYDPKSKTSGTREFRMYYYDIEDLLKKQ